MSSLECSVFLWMIYFLEIILVLILIITRILLEQGHLEKKKATIKKDLFVLQMQLQTAIGHLIQLQYQYQVLKDHDTALFSYDLKSLKEIEIENASVRWRN